MIVYTGARSVRVLAATIPKFVHDGCDQLFAKVKAWPLFSVYARPSRNGPYSAWPPPIDRHIPDVNAIPNACTGRDFRDRAGLPVAKNLARPVRYYWTIHPLKVIPSAGFWSVE